MRKIQARAGAVQQAVESGTAVPVIAQALFQRFASRQDDAFADPILTALHREFGGHAVSGAGSVWFA